MVCIDSTVYQMMTVYHRSSVLLGEYQCFCLLNQCKSVSSVQCIIKAAVGCAECISATVYWIRVQVYHLSSRVRGVYRSYCVSDQNPPPPQCQPAPVLAHTQGGRDVRWKAGEIFWRGNPRKGSKVILRVTMLPLKYEICAIVNCEQLWPLP